jgi:hypothetical protein
MGGRPGVQIPVVSWRRKRVATVPEVSSLFGQIDEQLPFTPAVPGYFCRLGRTQLICAAAEKFVGSFATWWFHLGNCYGQTVPKLDCHEARRIIFEGKNICSLERAKKKKLQTTPIRWCLESGGVYQRGSFHLDNTRLVVVSTHKVW